jgi:hypothetical protein
VIAVAVTVTTLISIGVAILVMHIEEFLYISGIAPRIVIVAIISAAVGGPVSVTVQIGAGWLARS